MRRIQRMAAAEFYGAGRPQDFFFAKTLSPNFADTLVNLAADSPCRRAALDFWRGSGTIRPRPGHHVLELTSRPEFTQRRSGRPGEASTLSVEKGMEYLVEHRHRR